MSFGPSARRTWLVLAFAAAVFAGVAHAQEEAPPAAGAEAEAFDPVDAEALAIARRAGDFLREAKRFSFRAESGYEVVQEDGSRLVATVTPLASDRSSSMNAAPSKAQPAASPAPAPHLTTTAAVAPAPAATTASAPAPAAPAQTAAAKPPAVPASNPHQAPVDESWMGSFTGWLSSLWGWLFS